MYAKTKRRTFKGVPVSAGIGMGTSHLLQRGALRIAGAAIPPARIDNEIDSLETAIADTISELHDLRKSAGRKVDGPVAKIFDAQLLIAGDYEFLNQVKKQIRNKRRNAAHCYNLAVQEATAPLKNSPDNYIQQMAVDIDAVARKVLMRLSGTSSGTKGKFPSDTILVCQQFGPSDILAYRNRKATGFVSGYGSRNSHMALIARSLLVPVVVVEKDWSGIPGDCRIIIDGSGGLVIVNPTDSEWQEYLKKRKRQGPVLISRIKKLKPIPPRTADGKEITIAANLELPGPADDILSKQRIPVGLYRTEFLYLEREKFPSEDEQQEYFCSIAGKFAGSHAVIRTFDLGADKMLDNSSLVDEANPALGWRGIRAMLDMPDIFKAQIRAILRASTSGNLKIMLPMVSDLSEFEEAKKIISVVMRDLKRDGISFDEQIKIGIMIEVPAAAIAAEVLARKVDFMSIGTNDLTQYTMSADRNNRRVAGLYNFFHPSVLKLIKMTVDACHNQAIPISICGEAAGDPLAVPLFLGMGVTYLSMNPQKIVDVSRLIKKIDFEMAKQLVSSVMSASTSVQVIRCLRSYNATI